MPKASYQTCTEISPQCPLSATTYGYYPNFAGNLVLCIVFGICLLLQIGFSIKGRTWTWLIALFIGCALEFVGYIGRLLMNKNPWNKGAFESQLVVLIIGPSAIAAGIDLTLKHLVIHFGPRYSLIKPALYTWVFVCTDIFSIVMQAIGGSMAASGKTNLSLLNAGNNVILAGIAIQVAQLVAFGGVCAHYAWNCWRHRGSHGLTVTPKLRLFLPLLILAYLTILIRCIYRLPEMAGGWGSALQRNEVDFLILDGAMVAIAVICLTIGHPAFLFPVMGKGKHRVARDTEKQTRDGQVSSGDSSE